MEDGSPLRETTLQSGFSTVDLMYTVAGHKSLHLCSHCVTVGILGVTVQRTD